LSERPLRVLHVITRMIVGGAQENTMLSCALIDRERFPSELLTGTETGAEGELLTETRARGVTIHLEPALVRAIHPWRDAVALGRMARFIEHGRYDVVHTHCSKAGILGRIAARMARVPVIVHTYHGLPWNPTYSGPFNRFVTWIERACTRADAALVVVAEADRVEVLTRDVGRPDQFTLIRSGIEIEAYRDVATSRGDARARVPVPEDGFVVGSVGRLSLQKAPLDLVSAFARLARSRPDAHLVMVGDGPLRAEVEAAVASAGIADRVHLVGLRRDVPELLRAFDVFALASRYEGLPRVFPQAMAAGLPIVATHVDGAADVVVPGENGFLVEVGDLDGFARRLGDLAADRARARAMGERGRERVEEFSAHRMVRQLEELYGRMARAKGLWAA
jgi:glycosyltransferase involved in cell wall biosynthesis